MSVSKTIQLVAGDDKPDIAWILADKQQNPPVPLNLFGVTVKFRFRSAGSKTTLFEKTLIIIDDVQGSVRLVWGATDLDQTPGPYEGEIFIDDGGAIRTILDKQRFQINPQFAAP